MKNWPRWRNLKWAIAPKSQRTCVADSSSSRHLSQVVSSSIPVWKGVPLDYKCPVNSPSMHLNWSLLNFNRSFVLLAEGPVISPFAWLNSVVDFHCFVWFLFVQSLTMPQAGSGPVNGCSDPVLVSRSLLFHLQQYPHDLAPISVELCWVWPVVWGVDGNLRPVLRWCGIYQVGYLIEYRYFYSYSPYLDSRLYMTWCRILLTGILLCIAQG
jgi:hypothetical protein